MNFIAIDVETGGLDCYEHDLLEIGLVNQTEDWRRIVFIHDCHTITPFCIEMHQGLFQEIARYRETDDWKNRSPATCHRPNEKTYYVDVTGSENNMVEVFNECLEGLSGKQEGKINVAGKNFQAFDLLFLEQAGLFDNDSPFTFHRRVLDPAILWARPDDEYLPDLSTCLERAGLEAHVAHSGVADALNVVRLINVHVAKINAWSLD